ncbi:MAG: protein translocase subunit SecF [Thermoanaerobaculia bacterium]|nr:protein translocase subunit SecF [Thermoanaerobaculia bacterium]
MQFLTDTKIPFLKYRKLTVWLSIILSIVAVVELFFFKGLNLGIDFTGGTQITVRFRDKPEIDALRQQVTSAKFAAGQLQRIGAVDDHEVLIKVPVVEGSEEGSAESISDLLDKQYNPGRPAGSFDLNQRGTESLGALLAEADPDGKRAAEAGEDPTIYYEGVAEKIIDARNEKKIFTGPSDLDAIAEVSPQVISFLKENAFFGSFNVLSTENVGPQIGAELRRKGILAVVFALIGMLVYIWFRFELRFGIGALVASFHDVLITLGLYALMNYEFNLPTIAAFLTLVGYSVNDTVIIFDRVRENMRKHRRMELIDVMDYSVNQTLARTIMTSGTTLLAVIALFVWGGEVIRGFAFVMLVGVIVGTYSSVYIASPFALLWEQYFGRAQREARERAAQQKKAGQPASARNG